MLDTELFITENIDVQRVNTNIESNDLSLQLSLKTGEWYLLSIEEPTIYPALLTQMSTPPNRDLISLNILSISSILVRSHSMAVKVPVLPESSELSS